MTSVLGLKKCPKCGYKDLYGCLNYYTIGAPFFCPKCGTEMHYYPRNIQDKHLPKEKYEETKKYLEDNLDKLDVIITDLGNGRVRIKWTLLICFLIVGIVSAPT